MSRESRREELRGLMDRLGLGALLMSRPANFAWYTGGADNRVDHADPLGADTAAAVSEAAGSLEPHTSELEAAANLAAACRRQGIFAPMLLAASEERIGRYRHPIPRGGTLGRRAMLVVCAERGGLYANLTRMVDFEEPDREISRRQEACDAILRRMREEATRPGRTLADALADCRRFYAEEGFPDGWKDHHQGGMTGYASREVVATPETRREIGVGQAFAGIPLCEARRPKKPSFLPATVQRS